MNILAISPVSHNSAYFLIDKSGEFNSANAAYLPGLKPLVSGKALYPALQVTERQRVK